ncbi:MAG TPA: PAS domain-containing protein [Candidatus Limnocylindrales bacterium]|nr:PAS domain-containing protein [Candidatus Limnocylindrales bacterium]
MRQHPVELILARNLAARLAMPTLLVDGRGELLYANRPAEDLLGQAGVGPDRVRRLAERVSSLDPHDPDEQPIVLAEMPGTVALQRGRPTHREIHVVDVAGRDRHVSVTAIPIELPAREIVGALIMFWEVD